MSLHLFIKTFCLCFVVLISVGPVFLTTANIAMTRGYRAGFFCILGCIIGDIIFITTGALCANAVVSAIPKPVFMLLSLFAGLFLIHIAYGFWKTDLSKIKAKTINKKNFALTLKMLCLTLSSPLSIVGYGAIFSSVIDASNSIVSAILGGCMAAIFTHSLIVCGFGILGKKINMKILSILNKVSAGMICFYALLLIIKFTKEMIDIAAL